MVCSQNQQSILTYIQLIIFVLVILFFQNKLYTLAFLFSFSLILYLVFSGRKKRLFGWVIAAFLLGNLLYLYFDRMLELLPYSVNSLIILSRFLLLFPILFLAYVIRKFKEEINHYWKKPNWQAIIFFPFIWRGFHSISIKVFLFVAIGINACVFLPFMIKSNLSYELPFLLFIFLFSAINGVLEEILWRGILLTRMADLAGEKAAVIFSGIAFGFSHLILGYSWVVCFAFTIGGFFYAGITVRSGSILPAIIWHFFFNIFMILSGIITYH